MKLRSLFTVFLLSFFSAAWFAQNTDEDKMLETLRSISSHDLLKITEELCSDKQWPVAGLTRIT